MKIIINESVSYAVVEMLRAKGFSVVAIADFPLGGTSDEEVYNLVIKEEAILITRDYHFTNSIRFPAHKTKGIIYIRRGNLKAEEERDIVLNFFANHKPEEFSGKLVTLYKDCAKIR